MDNRRTLDVTILTGFLGSGKTSTLNHLTQAFPEKAFAVVENELGSVSIDKALILGIPGSDVFDLSDGCICCNLSEDLYLFLYKLLETQRQFDHLLIETTGMADPFSVVQPFLTDEELAPRFRVNTVLAVADALNLPQSLRDQPETRRQLELASLIVLNKADLVDAETLAQRQRLLLEINPLAEITTATHGQFDTAGLLDRMDFDYARLATRPVVPARPEGIALTAAPHQGVSALTLRRSEPLPRQAFEAWLKMLLLLNDKSLYRVKGIVRFRELPEQAWVAQAVRHSFLLLPVGSEVPAPAESQLVLIGKNLDGQALAEAFEELAD